MASLHAELSTAQFLPARMYGTYAMRVRCMHCVHGYKQHEGTVRGQIHVRIVSVSVEDIAKLKYFIQKVSQSHVQDQAFGRPGVRILLTKNVLFLNNVLIATNQSSVKANEIEMMTRWS